MACEFSGRVTQAFRKKGVEAYSCDLLPGEYEEAKEWHIIGDAVELLGKGWDLIIAHPPCTRLCNSGVRWLQERNLWQEMEEGALFFKKFLDAPANHICVENPIMHGYAKDIIGRGQDQIVHPWQFGHPDKKSTCLWLKNLPLLTPTNIIPKEYWSLRLTNMSQKKDRAKLRSITFEGIAEAMAEQWIPLLKH